MKGIGHLDVRIVLIQETRIVYRGSAAVGGRRSQWKATEKKNKKMLEARIASIRIAIVLSCRLSVTRRRRKNAVRAFRLIGRIAMKPCQRSNPQPRVLKSLHDRVGVVVPLSRNPNK